jgi:hypothetical protein
MSQKPEPTPEEVNRLLRDNLFAVVDSFNSKVIAKKGGVWNIPLEKPESFDVALHDYANTFQHRFFQFPCGDTNTMYLGSMGAFLLSWSIAISKAKIQDADRMGLDDNQRKMMMEKCDRSIREYLHLVVALSSEIAPKFNKRNSPIFQNASKVPKSNRENDEPTK